MPASLPAFRLRQPVQVIQNAYEGLGSRVSRASEKARLERGERAIARLTEQLDRLVGALPLYKHSKRMQLASVPVAPLIATSWAPSYVGVARF